MKKVKFYFAWFCVVCLFCNIMLGQTILAPEIAELESKFRSQYGQKCKIIWNESSGTINRIYGVKIKPDISGSTLEVAKSFIIKNKEIFGVDNFIMYIVLKKEIRKMGLPLILHSQSSLMIGFVQSADVLTNIIYLSLKRMQIKSYL